MKRALPLFLLAALLSGAAARADDAADFALLSKYQGELRILDLTRSGEPAARRLALLVNRANPKFRASIMRRESPTFRPNVALLEKSGPPDALPYAGTVVRVVVNAKNPLSGLTMEQLRDIYSGEAAAWQKFNASPYSIHRYGVAADQPGAELFFEKVLNGEKPATLFRASNARELYLLVGANANSIGFAASPPEKDIRNVKILAVNGVLPASEEYPLLQRRCVLVGTANPAAAPFARLLRSMCANTFPKAGKE